MTIPWQHNCPHISNGWCLDCLQQWIETSIRPCQCKCHIEGMNVVHVTNCCKYTYKQYLYMHDNHVKLDGPKYLEIVGSEAVDKIRCKKCKRNI